MLSGAGLGATLPFGSLLAADPFDEIYRKSIVIDGNLIISFDTGHRLPDDVITAIKTSGLTTIKYSIGGYDDDFEQTQRDLEALRHLIETHPDLLLQVKTPGDITRAKRTGRLGIIFSFEEVTALEGRLDRIDFFASGASVRVMQLSYNLPSPFASGVLSPQPSRGLTPLGHQAVERMMSLGVTVDLSHADAPSTFGVLAMAAKPVLITHAGCDAVYPHPRNKTDDELRLLAKNGGVIGIYDLPFLTASPHQPNLDDYLQHMKHALNVCGEDHVGIGSDMAVTPFDTSPAAMAAFNEDEAERHQRGVAAPGEDRPLYVVGLNRPDRTRIICDALLKRGYPARVVEKVLGRNFERVFRETWR